MLTSVQTEVAKNTNRNRRFPYCIHVFRRTQKIHFRFVRCQQIRIIGGQIVIEKCSDLFHQLIRILLIGSFLTPNIRSAEINLPRYSLMFIINIRNTVQDNIITVLRPDQLFDFCQLIIEFNIITTPPKTEGNK